MQSSTDAQDGPDPANQSLAAALVSALVLVASIDSQVIGAVAPEIAEGLGTASQVVATSVVFYAVSAALVALAVGRWWRGQDPATWLPACAVLFGAASAMAAVAPGPEAFFAARSLAGAAGGLVSALAIAALANASTYARRGRQMTGVAVSYFVAPVLGVPLGAYLADRLGWRSLFAGLTVASLVAAACVWRFRLAGAQTGPRPARAASLGELLTRTRSSALGVAGAFFVSGGLVGFTTFLGTWLSDAFGAGTRTVGLVYAVAGIGAVAGGAAGGMLADRLGKRRVAAVCSLAMAGLLPVVVGLEWGAALFAGIGATAVAAALRVAPLQALVTELVDPSERAAYIALRNTASQLGIASTVAAGNLIYPAAGMAGIAWLCASLSLVAWLSTWALREPSIARVAPEGL
jgi:predicted MFS family arabinose efflux permease